MHRVRRSAQGGHPAHWEVEEDAMIGTMTSGSVVAVVPAGSDYLGKALPQ